VLDEIVAEPETAHFQRARATFIRVTAELARRGLPALQERPRKAFPATPGRPLAQSLRVGRKLRWIERLAIKSYLDNGWRFQLYAYDDPDNVPDGCEVLDAAAIIPATCSAKVPAAARMRVRSARSPICSATSSFTSAVACGLTPT
jgi:hypothetical protein